MKLKAKNAKNLSINTTDEDVVNFVLEEIDIAINKQARIKNLYIEFCLNYGNYINNSIVGKLQKYGYSVDQYGNCGDKIIYIKISWE